MASDGPWKVVVRRENMGRANKTYLADYLLVGRKVKSLEEAEANARLFTAAPDLLAACESVAEALRGPLPVDPANVISLLEGAIARAKGG